MPFVMIKNSPERATVFSAKNPAKGSSTLFKKSSTVLDKSARVAANLSKAEASTSCPTSPNFLLPCSRISFAKACLCWNLVSSDPATPNEAAYFADASSSLTKIPNSSRISGSSFAAPLVNLSTASPTSLPRAVAAAFATSASPSICVELKLADEPTEIALRAWS